MPGKKATTKKSAKPARAKAAKAAPATRKPAAPRPAATKAPPPVDALSAQTVAGLDALRARIEDTGASGRRPAQAQKRQAALAEALDRLEADYRRTFAGKD